MGSLWIETHYGEAPGGKFNRQLRRGSKSQRLELLNVLKSAKVCVPPEKIKMSATKALFQ